MNIYFAASIRGGGIDLETCRKLVNHLKKRGRVFTGQICEEIESPQKVRHTDEEIYLRDLSWLKGADILVAEVSIPSLGVGYEIGKAEDLGIRILCLYKEGAVHKLSAMIEGNKNLHVRKYNLLNEALLFIDSFFEKDK